MSKLKTTPVVTTTKTTTDFRPMLLALGKIDKMKDFPYILQNKYDGVRCIAIKQLDGGVKTYSRAGNEFNIPHLNNAISKIFERFPAITHLDGEIYQHGKLLEEISGLVKRYDNDCKKDLWYQIYDIPIEETKMQNRIAILKIISQFIKEIGADNLIKCDCGTVVYDIDEMEKFYKESLKNKYEGSVATKNDSYYKTDTRSSLKLKLKPNDSDEFVCVGHYYGNGKCSKMSTLILATKEANDLGYASSTVFESFVKTKTKKFIEQYYFHVKMNGNNDRREAMAANFDIEFKDKMITVEYYSLSNNNVPRGAKGVAVRDYE